jgi:hypothetical protein
MKSLPTLAYDSYLPYTVKNHSGTLTEKGKAMLGFSQPIHSLTTGNVVFDSIIDALAFNDWKET